jgi:hypothetical protein
VKKVTRPVGVLSKSLASYPIDSEAPGHSNHHKTLTVD